MDDLILDSHLKAEGYTYKVSAISWYVYHNKIFINGGGCSEGYNFKAVFTDRAREVAYRRLCESYALKNRRIYEE